MIDVFGGIGGGYGAQGKFHTDPVTGALVPVVVESTTGTSAPVTGSVWNLPWAP